MCGSWYFPNFLLSGGSLIPMYMASFMFLVTTWLWWYMGDGALRCSLSLSPNDLPDSPMYFSEQLMCGHLNLYMTPLFCCFQCPLGDEKGMVLMVLHPLKCTWISKLLQVLLNFSPSLCMYGTPPWRYFCCLIHCCWCWVHYWWLFVHCGCWVYGWICFVDCCKPMVGNCRPVGPS